MDLTLVAGQTLTLPAFRITPPPPPAAVRADQHGWADAIVTDPEYRASSSHCRPIRASSAGTGSSSRRSRSNDPAERPARAAAPRPDHSALPDPLRHADGRYPQRAAAGDAAERSGARPGQQAEIWWDDAAPPVAPVPGRWPGSEPSARTNQDRLDPASVSTGSAASPAWRASSAASRKQINRFLNSPIGGDPVDLAIGQMVVDRTGPGAARALSSSDPAYA